MTAAEFAALRQRLGLTQAEFGALLGISQGAVGHYETGRRTVSKTVAILAQHLGSTKPRG
jgi:transcriptional regulator with XRE-family HTH domain